MILFMRLDAMIKCQDHGQKMHNFKVKRRLGIIIGPYKYLYFPILFITMHLIILQNGLRPANATDKVILY